jgi:hypothetical protein
LRLSTSKSGRKLIKGIMDSDKTCTIRPGDYGRSFNTANSVTGSRNGEGSDTTIKYDPTYEPDVWTLNPATGAGNFTSSPSYLVLGHELVHAYHSMNGILIPPSITKEHQYVDGIGNTAYATERVEELITVGIFPHEGTNVTENMIRADLGFQERIKYN